jgi:hypothetical protein
MSWLLGWLFWEIGWKVHGEPTGCAAVGASVGTDQGSDTHDRQPERLGGVPAYWLIPSVEESMRHVGP